MCRKRGRIVLVGVVGLELSRADFYEKELVSGVLLVRAWAVTTRQYEEAGQDYPLGFRALDGAAQLRSGAGHAWLTAASMSRR